MLLLLPFVINSIAAVSSQASDFRIVGGRPVSIKKRPFQASLWRSDIYSKSPVCGGSIINKRWILTAAHCIHGLDVRTLYARVGTDNLQTRGRNQLYKIAKAIAHDGYNGVASNMMNDIGLMRTEKDMIFNRNVQPIKLRTKSPIPNTEAVVSGFGLTRPGSRSAPTVLSQVSVNVLERKLCAKLLAKASRGALSLADSHFCAAELAGGRDACQGDSGGPITIDNVLAGIVSWGIGCAQKDVPAFYTDVSRYIDWMSDTMGLRPRTTRVNRPGT